MKKDGWLNNDDSQMVYEPSACHRKLEEPGVLHKNAPEELVVKSHCAIAQSPRLNPCPLKSIINV